MGAARRQRWGGGKRTRRRGRLLESLAGKVPWSELEQLGVRGPWKLAHPPHPNPLPEAEGPEISSLLRWGSGGTAAAPRVAAWEQQLRSLPRRVRRALQRHFALPLADLALILALWQGPAWTATINVDGITCTLAQAITAANTDTITGGCPAGTGADTLLLPPDGIITLTTVDNTSEGAAGLPVVSSTITIAGQGSTIARDGGSPYFRLLTVAAGGNLTMRDLTLQGGIVDDSHGGGVFNRGTLTLVNSTLSGNSAGLNGGGVFNLGTLTLANSTVSGNTANRGGGMLNSYGTLTLANSTLSGNRAYDEGGGVFNNYGAVTLVHSTLSGNSAYDGGGIYNNGSLTIANSTLSGNSGCCGGGIYNNGSLTIANSTLSGNVAIYNGGGVFNYGSLTLVNSTLSGNSAGSEGGGVSNEYSDLTLVNSTLSGNTAGYYGGGVSAFASDLTLVNSTLSGNSASTGGGVSTRGPSDLTLERTLVSGNTAVSGAEMYIDEGSSVTADSFNLFGHDTTSGVVGFDPGASDIVPTQALNAILDSSLAFNGGPTQTHALVPGSPALDAVTAGSCPATDQRGFVRPSGVGCDVGAVESGASPPPVVSSPMSFVVLPETFSTTTDPTGCPGGFAGKFSFQAQLTNLDGSLALLALKEAVVSLSNGNLLQTADGGLGGVGGQQTLPQVGPFSDGVLEPMGTVVVPIVICLQNLDQFLFEVDVLGLNQSPPP
jgi:hypothetical protein